MHRAIHAPVLLCSPDELERLVEEAEAHRAEDKEILKNSEARQGLESYLYRWVEVWGLSWGWVGVVEG